MDDGSAVALRADPNLPEEQIAPRGKALYSAVYHGHYDIAKLLLERGAFPNPPVESSGDALWISQEWRPDKRMEQLLLSYGVKPAKGHTGEDWPKEAHNWLRISPLHQAARKGDVGAAKKLLEAGADLTARDDHLRSTPLAWAGPPRLRGQSSAGTTRSRGYSPRRWWRIIGRLMSAAESAR